MQQNVNKFCDTAAKLKQKSGIYKKNDNFIIY